MRATFCDSSESDLVNPMPRQGGGLGALCRSERPSVAASALRLAEAPEVSTNKPNSRRGLSSSAKPNSAASAFALGRTLEVVGHECQIGAQMLH
jgi:hypothetical protein